MKLAACPMNARLTAYALGKLPEDALREVADHARGCRPCQAALEAADQDSDALIQLLRRPRSANGPVVEAALTRVLQEAITLAPVGPVAPDRLLEVVEFDPLPEPPPQMATASRGPLRTVLRFGIVAAAVMLLFLAGLLGGFKLGQEFQTAGKDPGPLPVVKTEPLPAPVKPPAAAPEWQRGPVGEAFLRAVAAMPPDRQVHTVTAKLKELNPDFHGEMNYAVGITRVVEEYGFKTDHVTDVTPVRALTGLSILRCAGSAPGKGKLADLSPLKGLKLTRLQCQWNPTQDLTPLLDMPLEVLLCNCKNERDVHLLRTIKTLKRINRVPASVFWQRGGPLVPAGS